MIFDRTELKAKVLCVQVDQFVYITDHTYTRDEVLSTEEQVLDVLDFELTQPTAKTFLRRFIQVHSRSPCTLLSYAVFPYVIDRVLLPDSMSTYHRSHSLTP